MNVDMLNQEFIEKRYNRKHIDGYIREEIQANPEMVAKIEDGAARLHAWMHGQYYESKMVRLKQLHAMDLHELVLDVLVGIAYFLREELFTSVTAQLAGRLRFSLKVEGIKTMAEIMAVLCQTDAFDILKASRSASLVVVSRVPLSDKLVEFIEHSQYLPPMVCEPRVLTGNHSSGYLTHVDSLILGQGNHHDGQICLDVLNIANSVPLKLNTEFLSSYEEQPTYVLDTQEKVDQWKQFKLQSYKFYSLMVTNGNRFWLCHKVDKRGRIYACGYHISTMGTAFKKASIELADEEIVKGVPGI